MKHIKKEKSERARRMNKETNKQERDSETRNDSLTRFMISVRSPWASSSGVGGSGLFGGPPLLLCCCCCDELVAVSPDKIEPGLYENSGLIKIITFNKKKRYFGGEIDKMEMWRNKEW